MLNGSNKEAPVSNRARLVAVGTSSAALSAKEGATAPGADQPVKPSAPERMQWFVVPCITLGSALAGGAAAWLTR